MICFVFREKCRRININSKSTLNRTAVAMPQCILFTTQKEQNNNGIIARCDANQAGQHQGQHIVRETVYIIKWFLTFGACNVSHSASFISLRAFPQVALRILDLERSDSTTLSTKHELRMSPRHRIQNQTQNSKNMSQTSVFKWEHAKQRTRVFLDFILSVTNEQLGSRCVWETLDTFEWFPPPGRKKFSKPVLCQRVTVEPFIAFLLAWDLISKYKDLDRDLLSNSYIVL